MTDYKDQAQPFWIDGVAWGNVHGNYEYLKQALL